MAPATHAAATIPGPDPRCSVAEAETSRYACDPKRRYTPQDALPGEYARMLRTLGVERTVLMQLSVYMTDHSALLDTHAKTAFPLRAVAVVANTITDAELAQRVSSRSIRARR
jgi:predicted TIM-barrel fold metal-dependent hydrolase